MPPKSIHEDIEWLEAQLESKKQALREQGESKEEREMIKDIIKESAPSPLTPSPSILNPASDDAQKKAHELEEKEHEEIIQHLVDFAFTKNLNFALRAAAALRNPHLLDEFHDLLADRYYEKLLETRKIKP